MRHHATWGVTLATVIRRPKLRIAWETRVSEHGSKAATADAAHAGETRRDFIHIAAATVAAGGVLSVAWPFVQQLGPAADTKADREKKSDDKPCEQVDRQAANAA